MNSFWIIQFVLGAAAVLIYLICIKDQDIKLSDLYKMLMFFCGGIITCIIIILICAEEFSDTVIYKRKK